MVVFPVVFLRNVVLGKLSDEGACEENKRALEFRSVGVWLGENVGKGRKSRSEIRGKLTDKLF